MQKTKKEKTWDSILFTRAIACGLNSMVYGMLSAMSWAIVEESILVGVLLLGTVLFLALILPDTPPFFDVLKEKGEVEFRARRLCVIFLFSIVINILVAAHLVPDPLGVFGMMLPSFVFGLLAFIWLGKFIPNADSVCVTQTIATK